jgi:SEC-C motif-containing protein
MFDDCCSPLLDGRQNAATAEMLMRSRYTAYVLKNESYLLQTWHESSRPAQLNLDQDNIQWLGLQVIECEEGGMNDETGKVEFIASYKAGGKNQRIHERSCFVKQNMHWCYVGGEIENKQNGSHKTDKIGRNDPCPCGSGKKYKKCCG